MNRQDYELVLSTIGMGIVLVLVLIAHYTKFVPDYLGVESFPDFLGYLLYGVMLTSVVLGAGPFPVRSRWRFLFGYITLLIAVFWIPLFNSIPDFWILFFFGTVVLAVIARETRDYHRNRRH